MSLIAFQGPKAASTLQNLVAENKLDEPFLWIPDLEGPVYTEGPGVSLLIPFAIFAIFFQ
jgi:hypothetical protein